MWEGVPLPEGAGHKGPAVWGAVRRPWAWGGVHRAAGAARARASEPVNLRVDFGFGSECHAKLPSGFE